MSYVVGLITSFIQWISIKQMLLRRMGTSRYKQTHKKNSLKDEIFLFGFSSPFASFGVTIVISSQV
jgi:hypothetical protein